MWSTFENLTTWKGCGKGGGASRECQVLLESSPVSDSRILARLANSYWGKTKTFFSLLSIIKCQLKPMPEVKHMAAKFLQHIGANVFFPFLNLPPVCCLLSVNEGFGEEDMSVEK